MLSRLPPKVKVFKYSTLRGEALCVAHRSLYVPAVWTQNPYYMVEFKPALGWVFREYLKDYTHWAYGDLDVFFGDLTKGWLEASEMREYDVVTYRSVVWHTASFPCVLRNPGRSNVPYKRFMGSDTHGQF